ncbi:flagellar hook-associated protein FlgL [Zoogloea sp.]|uniref:flagellar hook-associated protein FlgL n=1 Tax=Zoogloea sp. TaxID=49181 RepID=UPI0035AE825D|nr:flagellar hook-associated protein FlgL [Rhodocyclales bacterium]
MRITTGMIFEKNLSLLQKQNSKMADASAQLSSGRRVLAPSDDPVAAARALEVSQSQSVNRNYESNQGYASDALSLVDSKLSAANDLVTYVRTRAVEAGNGSYSATELKAIASDLGQQFTGLQSIANSQDSTGEYIFGGLRSNVQPFTGNIASGVSYQGDQGTRNLQISASRSLPITSSGDEIFNTIRAPAGSAYLLGAAGNGGTALPSAMSLSGGYNGHSYAIEVGAGPSYTFYDNTNDPGHASPITPTVSVSGSDTTLSIPGISMTLSGVPATGDKFSLSTVASAFDVLGSFVTALGSGNSAAARFSAKQTIAGMDATQNSISQVQAGVGSRMVEVETQQSISGDLGLQYSNTMSRLQDADYAKSISDLTQQKTYLEASQQAFLKVSNLSLFNYLN